MVVEILLEHYVFRDRIVGSIPGDTRWRLRGYSKLSAGLAGQDDGVTRGPFDRPRLLAEGFVSFSFVCRL